MTNAQTLLSNYPTRSSRVAQAAHLRQRVRALVEESSDEFCRRHLVARGNVLRDLAQVRADLAVLEGAC